MTELADTDWAGYQVKGSGIDTLVWTTTVTSDGTWYRITTDDGWRTLRAEITQEPEELPDDAIVPDVTEPLPPDPDIRTDPVPEDDATTSPEDPE